MRLRITNRSTVPDEEILPLIRFAARHFTVRGVVNVYYNQTRKTARRLYGSVYNGFCYTHAKTITLRSTREESHPSFPIRVVALSYFPGSKIPVNHYVINTPDEALVHLAAHEFAHLTPRGSKFRKSRIEVHAENKATAVLEAFRSPEGQAWVAAERARMKSPATVTPDADPAALKILAIDSRLKKWQSKLKRATNAIKKLQKSRKYYASRLLPL